MRKGYIKITDHLYSNMYDSISELFKYFRPTHIEFRYCENDMWYLYGQSEFFDEIKEGEPVPQYDVSFETNRPVIQNPIDGTITFGDITLEVKFNR